MGDPRNEENSWSGVGLFAGVCMAVVCFIGIAVYFAWTLIPKTQ